MVGGCCVAKAGFMDLADGIQCALHGVAFEELACRKVRVIGVAKLRDHLKINFCLTARSETLGRGIGGVWVRMRQALTSCKLTRSIQMTYR